MDERYMLLNPALGSWRELPGSMRPAGTSPTTTANLVRARNSLEVYDLSDGLPDPTPVQLSGLWAEDDEARLSARIDWWTWLVAGCTEYRRAERAPETVRGGSLIWAPAADTSRVATVTITLIPTRVRDPRALPSGAIQGF